jgi:serine/threonine protein kinase
VESVGNLSPGAALGRFQIVASIGSGGMGTVYRAIDPELGRTVAIKVLNEADGDPVARARLVREAKAMARLSHPNVVPVHEIGTGTPCFIVMELVPGGTLRQWLAEPRSIAEIVDAFEQAGRGLAAAHDAGLVHRDLKPENILRGIDGRVRVVDFGLVAGMPERAGEIEVAPDSPLEVSLTMTGLAVGTPAYMAPEQHRRESTDPRTDQFSFALAFYEALYGERPFAGATYREVVRNVLAGTVRPPSKDVPAHLRAALLRGLAVDPAARFPSMTALLAALEEAPAPIVVTSPGRRSRRLPIAIGGVVIAAGIGLAIAAPWSSTRATPPAAPAPVRDTPTRVAPVAKPPLPADPPPAATQRPVDQLPSEIRTMSRPGGGRRVRVQPPEPVVAPAASNTTDEAAERRRRRLELEEN